MQDKAKDAFEGVKKVLETGDLMGVLQDEKLTQGVQDAMKFARENSDKIG